jgi:hypothetical protein
MASAVILCGRRGGGDGVRVDRSRSSFPEGPKAGPLRLFMANIDLFWILGRAGSRVRVACAPIEAFTYVVLLLTAVGVPRESAWRIAHEKARLEKLQTQAATHCLSSS